MVVNQIHELFKGHYQVILDFPDKIDLYKIIDKSYKFVWGFEHIENAVEWSEYKHSLYGIFNEKTPVLARNIKMEFLLETEDFINYIPSMSQTIRIIQTNIEPPYYLNLDNLRGKGRYDLLKSKVDYLFELEMPGASDYSTIISPNREYLEMILNLIARGVI